MGEGRSVNVVSVDESLEMFQNSGVFITNRKVKEFLHLTYLPSVAKNLNFFLNTTVG